jgi:8-oxo-dGTP pyrophosphatase MutT (NUDIX family)
MRTRNTARAVMLDPADRVLLFEFDLPAGMIGTGPRHFWATPGGAIDPGEDVHAALRREVEEETGIKGCSFGPELWFGSNVLTFNGETTNSLERFFVVRSPTATLDTANWTDLEKQVMRAHRWWTVTELIAATDTIFPPRFGYLIDAYLKHGTNAPQEIPL